jgi:hypothetical protein
MPRPTKLLSKKKLHSAWQASRDRSADAGRPGIDNVISEIFKELFGTEALSRITDEGKKFLGMSGEDFGEPINDLEEF